MTISPKVRSKVKNWGSGFIVFLAIVLAGFSLLKIPLYRADPKERSKRLIEFSSEELLANLKPCLGEESAPVKIVMFGDYECPPCQAAWKALETNRQSHANAQIFFRHYPLTSIHPQALNAATISVLSEQSGSFQRQHSTLFVEMAGERKVSVKSKGILENSGKKAKLNAMKRIQHDIGMGRKLGITGTPTFFEVDKSGQVHQILNIAQYFKKKSDKLLNCSI